MIVRKDSIESMDSSQGGNNTNLGGPLQNANSSAGMMPSVWQKGNTRMNTLGGDSTQQFTSMGKSIGTASLNVNVGLVPNERDQESL